VREVPVVLFGEYIAAYGEVRALAPKRISIYLVSPNGKGLVSQ